MEIKKTDPVNINSGVIKTPKNKPALKIEQKTVQKSAQEAAENYGRASVKQVSFGNGNCIVAAKSGRDFDGSVLTDGDFVKYKSKIEERVQSLSEDVRRSFDISQLNKHNIILLDRIISDKKLCEDLHFLKFLSRIIEKTDTSELAEARVSLLDTVRGSDKLSGNDNLMMYLGHLLFSLRDKDDADVKSGLLKTIADNEVLSGNKHVMKSLGNIVSSTNTKELAEAKTGLLDTVLRSDVFCENDDLSASLTTLTEKRVGHNFFVEMKNFFNTIIQSRDLAENDNLIKSLPFMISLISDENEIKGKTVFLKTVSGSDELLKNESLMNNVGNITRNTKSRESADSKTNFLNAILRYDVLSRNENLSGMLGRIIEFTNTSEISEAEVKVTDTILQDERLSSNKNIADNLGQIILTSRNKENAEAKLNFLDTVLNDDKLNSDKSLNDNLGEICALINNPSDSESLNELISLVKKDEITGNQVIVLFKDDNDITLKELQKLNDIIGCENAKSLSFDETLSAVKFADIYEKQKIAEVPGEAKRALLRNLVSSNSDIFNMSDNFRKMFPMLPRNQEEYCSLLPALVKDIGIETNPAEASRAEKLNSDMKNLSASLSKLSDEEFNALDFKHEYETTDFIKDTIETLKDLNRNERQKVYDYFGFELHQNKDAKYKTENGTGYSLTGYPVNLKNGKKTARIDDEKTKAVVEQLRPLVIKFSENNKITSGNEEIDAEINSVLEVLPELHSTVGRIQHKTQDFDVFKHSLKVMQKISQNPEFEKLNDSDKKIMLLASLMHDIAKKEGVKDRKHTETSSFDSFFITKKLNLSDDEAIKLYTLIKNHEWLGYVNTASDAYERIDRIQNVSYDLRHDNIFDMSLMFTHADLKAVKKDDSFHDDKDGKNRTDFFGRVRSFGESADFFAKKIKSNIIELQKSQPILPVTKFPKASKIDEAITTVNDDGSTNIKGVYKDKKGLTVIKFNEVEDWEKIGFPKGSVSKGITTETSSGEPINTGNIHFLVHGLDFAHQIEKFDAFSLIDSDALLSVSYAERPESKFRFFRPHGIILDCDTKFIHGGGDNDSGSGCGKTTEEYKRDYIFGGERTADRLYIANMIKYALNMNAEEYIEFVKENANKSFCEIEPEELRNKLVKAFAEINSDKRKGEREYNEMYISNPKPPMAVFAYNMNGQEKIGNPIEFLNRQKRESYYTGVGIEHGGFASVKERTEFLQKYALEHDIPFVVFGD